MGKWDDDYRDSDAYLGYDHDDAKLDASPTELAGDPYAAGGSAQKLVEKLLPPHLRTYEHLVRSGVRQHVGWLSPDQKRDALNVAAAALFKAAGGRKPQFSEAQFCAYVQKSISGELRRHYAIEIAYRSGRGASPEIGLLYDAPETDHKRQPATAPRKNAVPLNREDKLQHRQQRYKLAAGLLPSRHLEILRRRAEGETLQAIGTDLGVSAQRVRELEQRADTMLNQQLTRRSQGEPYHILVREAVTQDPANANLDPYEIDNLVRSWVNPGARQPAVPTHMEAQLEGESYTYDPDNLGDVRTEDDYPDHLDEEDEDLPPEDDDDRDYYEDWQNRDASLLEGL